MKRSDFAILIPCASNSNFIDLKFLQENPELDKVYGSYKKEGSIDEIIADCRDYNRILVSSIEEVNKRI